MKTVLNLVLRSVRLCFTSMVELTGAESSLRPVTARSYCTRLSRMSFTLQYLLFASFHLYLQLQHSISAFRYVRCSTYVCQITQNFFQTVIIRQAFATMTMFLMSTAVLEQTTDAIVWYYTLPGVRRTTSTNNATNTTSTRCSNQKSDDVECTRVWYVQCWLLVLYEWCAISVFQILSNFQNDS